MTESISGNDLGLARCLIPIGEVATVPSGAGPSDVVAGRGARGSSGGGKGIEISYTGSSPYRPTETKTLMPYKNNVQQKNKYTSC